jgi:hypothetical protein
MHCGGRRAARSRPGPWRAQHGPQSTSRLEELGVAFLGALVEGEGGEGGTHENHAPRSPFFFLLKKVSKKRVS